MTTHEGAAVTAPRCSTRVIDHTASFETALATMPADLADIAYAYVRFGGVYLYASARHGWLARCPLMCGRDRDGFFTWEWSNRIEKTGVYAAARDNGDLRIVCDNGCRPAEILRLIGARRD